MTMNQFNAECTQRLIAPAIALENDKLVQALLAQDDDAVCETLDREF